MLAVLAIASLADVLWLIPDPGLDFRVFYTSTVEWTLGRQPYVLGGIDPPNLTPPVMLLVFAPFTLLPLTVARVAWAVTSLLCVAGSVGLAARDLSMCPRDVLLLVLASSATAIGLGLGQVSCLLMLLMTGAWVAMRRGKAATCGACLGAVCLVKPFYGLFLLWQVRNRDWRGATALVGVVAVGLVVSAAMVGTSGVVTWLTLFRQITWQANIYNASIDGVGARLFSAATDLPAATWTPLLVSQGVRVVVELTLMVVVAGLTVRALRTRRIAPPGSLATDTAVSNAGADVAERGTPASDAADVAKRGPTVTDTVHNAADATSVDDAFAALAAAGILLSPLAWVHYLPVSAAPVIAVLARRRILWSVSTLVLAAWPYQWLINRHYDMLGTLVVGQWAFASVMIILLATAVGRVERSGRGMGDAPAGVPPQD